MIMGHEYTYYDGTQGLNEAFSRLYLDRYHALSFAKVVSSAPQSKERIASEPTKSTSTTWNQ